MKRNIMGFQQNGLLNSNIDGNDLIILDYLCYQLLNSSLEKVLIENKFYVWVKNEMILEDLPFLKLQERSLYYRLEKLVKEKFIERKTKYTDDKIKKTYTTITQKTYELKFENMNSKNAQNQQEDTTINDFQEKEIKKDPKHHFGEYGRVMLTDKEYEKLIADFGKVVIDNQIKLLDEYVEGNNNKNKYSNFNLVLRKSIKNNWFSNSNNIGKSNFKPSGKNDKFKNEEI